MRKQETSQENAQLWENIQSYAERLIGRKWINTIMQSRLVESGEWQAQQGVKVIDASTDHLWPLLSCSPSLESTPPLLCLLEFYASTVSWLLVPTPLHQLLCGLMSCHHTYLSFSFKMIRACSDRIYSPSNDYTNIWHQVWVRGRVGKGQTSDLTISLLTFTNTGDQLQIIQQEQIPSLPQTFFLIC